MRLVTFNIQHARSPQDDLVDLGRFAAAVRMLDADVLALQEVDRDQPRSHRADLTAVAAEAMGATTHHFAPLLSGTAGEGWRPSTAEDATGTSAYGVALLSRYPVEHWRVLRLPRLRPPVPSPARGAGSRLRSEEPRAAVVGRVHVPSGPVTVVSTHLSLVPAWAQFQLRRLRAALRDDAGPVLLMGDLNMGVRTAVAVSGYRPLVLAPTHPGWAPRRQLDHILLRGALGPVGPGSAVQLGISDHRALVVEIGARG